MAKAFSTIGRRSSLFKADRISSSFALLTKWIFNLMALSRKNSMASCSDSASIPTGSAPNCS
ncbi:hypothetical protein [Duganella sp. SG902]|uniref:hypothetical protein n=1 Tax=Duganella sp. SG902 TaxID=2587016 RepID=UPI0035A5A371